jgi:hypothetical protein
MFENLERARRRLYLILPITIALIFALLFSAFGKSSYAGLVLMNRQREEPRDEGGVREPDELPADSVDPTEKLAEEVLAD